MGAPTRHYASAQADGNARVRSAQTTNLLGEVEPSQSDRITKCASVQIGTSVVEQTSEASNGLRVVPVKVPGKEGIVHALPDHPVNGIPMLIGQSSGPTACEFLRVLGVEVESQLDSGANISLISKRCLKTLLVRNGIADHEAEIHPSPHTRCEAVNGTRVNIIGAITLPIEKEGRNVYVEFQIPDEKPTYHIVLGTNALPSLGYQLVDTASGKDYLRVDQKRSLPPSRPVLNQVQCDESLSMPPYNKVPVQCKSRVADGDYLCRMLSGQEEILVKVHSGRVVVPLENRQSEGTPLSVDDLVAELETVEEIFTSTDMISSTIVSELITESTTEVDVDRLEALLRTIPEPSHPLTSEQRQDLNALLEEYSDVFALRSSELGRTDSVQHTIELLDEHPIRQPPRPIPFALREKVAEMIEDYLERRVIRPSNSPYSNPIVLVRKKDGSLRFCVDYRKLNAVTKKDAYPLPNIDTTLLSIGRMEFAASLDLDGAYWQICMDPASIEKTAFPTPNGLYEWTVMPFGLCNAVSTFQRFIERVLRGLIGSFVHVYLDDILVFSESWSEHLSHLKTVFERLRQAGVKLKPSKCHLAEKEIAYLGHKLDSHGVRKDESKVSSVRNYPRPMNAIELRRFLGLVGYYRKFIPRFAMIARPQSHHILCLDRRVPELLQRADSRHLRRRHPAVSRLSRCEDGPYTSIRDPNRCEPRGDCRSPWST
jgi:hypothetical protein